MVDRRVALRPRCALLAAACTAAALTAPEAYGQTSADSTIARSSYHTIHFVYDRGQTVNEVDLMAGVGRAFHLGRTDEWVVDLHASTGVTLWGTIRDLGYLFGVRPSVLYALKANRYDIGIPTDVYLIASSGVYYAWNMKETPGDWSVIPVIALGAGLRFRGLAEYGTLGVGWEERIGAWDSRLSWRIGIFLPRR